MVPFEEKFINENPIIAREYAFYFYKNYATILEAHQQLSYKPLKDTPLLSNENFGGIVIEKYSVVDVKYEQPELFDKGIAIYMVVQNPITYRRKTDQKGERFLIHGIWNFDTPDIKNFTAGLIREFGYYENFNYNRAGYDEVVDFLNLDFLKRDFEKTKLHTILSTPFR